MSEKQWCYSLDDETFNSGSFDSREAAIVDAVRQYDPEPGAVIYIARSSKPTLAELVDVDDLLEGVICRADDIAGEYADGFPDLSDVDKAGLEKLILSYLDERVSITFYRVTDSQAYVIAESDIEMAEQARAQHTMHNSINTQL